MRIPVLLIALFTTLFGAAQQYEITYPVSGSGGHGLQCMVIVKKSDGSIFSDPRKSDFKLASDVFDTIEFELLVSVDRKTVNLAPRYAYFPGDHIRVTDGNGALLTQFDIRTRKPTRVKVEEKDEPSYPGSRALPSFSVDSNITTSIDPIFFRNSGTSGNRYIGIINSDGTEIFSRAENQVQNFDLQPSGYLSYYDKVDDWFLLMDSSYSVVDTITGGGGLIADFHELVHTADGNSLLMCEDPQTMDMTSYGGLSNANVVGNIIQVLDANGVVLFNWRSWDHIDFNETSVLLTGGNIDYVHINSLEYDPNGNIIVSARNLNQVFMIDGTSGNFIWRLGGTQGDLVLVNDTDGLSLQHDARILSNGNLTVFDNGVTHSVPLASAKEYVIDTLAGTATLVWSYAHPLGEPSGRTGNAQRLPNGNTFINWGSRESDNNNPNFTEVNMLGEIVYQFRFTDGASHSCYRARRHPWDLTTGIHEEPDQSLSMYPNPAKEIISIKTPDGVVGQIDVFDLSGRMLLRSFESSTVNLSHLPSGSYIARVTLEDRVFSAKFVKE